MSAILWPKLIVLGKYVFRRWIIVIILSIFIIVILNQLDILIVLLPILFLFWERIQV